VRARPGTANLLAIVAGVAVLTYLVVAQLDGAATTLARPSLVNIAPTQPRSAELKPSSRSPAGWNATSSATGAGGLPSSAVVGVPPTHNLDDSRTISAPARVLIPSIGVDSALQSLGLSPDGSLQAPSQWQEAGWFAKGVRPGAVGPAVIAGHIDSVNGPAVFFRLRELRPGDKVEVRQQNGNRLAFVVEAVRSYPKAHFPTEVVYGLTSLPELRLITCTGDFDQARRSYVDNLVVSARLVTAGR
jgi:hypothetical protein